MKRLIVSLIALVGCGYSARQMPPMAAQQPMQYPPPMASGYEQQMAAQQAMAAPAPFAGPGMIGGGLPGMPGMPGLPGMPGAPFGQPGGGCMSDPGNSYSGTVYDQCAHAQVYAVQADRQADRGELPFYGGAAAMPNTNGNATAPASGLEGRVRRLEDVQSGMIRRQYQRR